MTSAGGEWNPPEWLKAALQEVLEEVEAEDLDKLDGAAHRRGLAFDSLSRMKRRWRQPKPCVVPDCGRRSIKKSHVLARGGPLSRIAEVGHVLQPDWTLGEDGRGYYFMREVGVGQASTFPGFCRHHEASFSSLDRAETLDAGLFFQQMLRTVARDV